jgi:hypothetical protein
MIVKKLKGVSKISKTQERQIADACDLLKKKGLLCHILN